MKGGSQPCAKKGGIYKTDLPPYRKKAKAAQKKSDGWWKGGTQGTKAGIDATAKNYLQKG